MGHVTLSDLLSSIGDTWAMYCTGNYNDYTCMYHGHPIQVVNDIIMITRLCGGWVDIVINILI